MPKSPAPDSLTQGPTTGPLRNGPGRFRDRLLFLDCRGFWPSPLGPPLSHRGAPHRLLPVFFARALEPVPRAAMWHLLDAMSPWGPRALHLPPAPARPCHVRAYLQTLTATPDPAATCPHQCRGDPGVQTLATAPRRRPLPPPCTDPSPPPCGPALSYLAQHEAPQAGAKPGPILGPPPLQHGTHPQPTPVPTLPPPTQQHWYAPLRRTTVEVLPAHSVPGPAGRGKAVPKALAPAPPTQGPATGRPRPRTPGASPATRPPPRGWPSPAQPRAPRTGAEPCPHPRGAIREDRVRPRVSPTPVRWGSATGSRCP